MVDGLVVHEIRRLAAVAEGRRLRAEARAEWDRLQLERLAAHIPADGWQDRAICQGATNLFFPDGHRYQDARRVCQSCPVAMDCLAEHLDEDYGCWAGTSPRQRGRIRTALRKLGIERVHQTAEAQRRHRVLVEASERRKAVA